MYVDFKALYSFGEFPLACGRGRGRGMREHSITRQNPHLFAAQITSAPETKSIWAIDSVGQTFKSKSTLQVHTLLAPSPLAPAPVLGKFGESFVIRSAWLEGHDN